MPKMLCSVSDIDECDSTTGVSLCPSDGACVNLPGTFDCRCPPGTLWNGVTGNSKCMLLRECFVFKDSNVTFLRQRHRTKVPARPTGPVVLIRSVEWSDSCGSKLRSATVFMAMSPILQVVYASAMGWWMLTPRLTKALSLGLNTTCSSNILPCES